MQSAILLIYCPDRKGIIAAVTNFIKEEGANIVYLDQHVDRGQDTFFMRLSCVFDKGVAEEGFRESFKKSIAVPLGINWQLHDPANRPKLALMVSKYDHCLYDLLARHASGELHAEIPIIISNHDTLRPVAERFEIPFAHIPVPKGSKPEAEAQQLNLLKSHDIDLVVLARYMQIISPNFVDNYPHRIINVHHSFLPAFVGAKPYHAAFERGVKIIGSTSHYVTSDLDEGPIIEQEIVRVSHIHNVQDFILKGRDLEKLVLARAIKAHLERKILVYGNKTVIFS